MYAFYTMFLFVVNTCTKFDPVGDGREILKFKQKGDNANVIKQKKKKKRRNNPNNARR